MIAYFQTCIHLLPWHCCCLGYLQVDLPITPAHGTDHLPQGQAVSSPLCVVGCMCLCACDGVCMEQCVMCGEM